MQETATELAGIPAATVIMPAPWWLGLPGIDPGCPVANLQHAAELIATALGARFLTVESAGSRLFNAPSGDYKLVTRWQEFLAAASSTADLLLRRVALHVVLEAGRVAHPNVLRTAQDLYQAGMARRDRSW
jgi:hypothetical protein